MLHAVSAAVFVVLTLAIGIGPARAGAIHGSVTLQGPPPPARKLPVTIDQYVCGDAKDAEDLVVSAKNGIRYVVAWLANPPATSSSGPPPVDIDQKGCTFTPRVVLAPAGGTVNFLNSDRLLHNLHGRPRSNAVFNRTQPKGRTIAMSFTRPEIFQVDCDLHSWMRAWVVVTEHPFYAVSDADGQFRLDGVPPGRYTLRTWHETLGTTSREVVVPDTGAAQVKIDLARPAGAK